MKPNSFKHTSMLLAVRCCCVFAMFLTLGPINRITAQVEYVSNVLCEGHGYTPCWEQQMGSKANIDFEVWVDRPFYQDICGILE